MIAFSLALLSLIHAPVEGADISRVFKAGEKLQYGVTSHLLIEQRERGLQTWFPQELDINYKFTSDVKEMKADGIADVHYMRPTITQVDGETPDSGPKTHVEKVNMDMILTISPINEIIGMKDLAKKDDKKPPKKGGGGLLSFSRHGISLADMQDPFGQYIQEIFRLSLFTGSFDSALDFCPKLPLDTVKPGDTWLKTVGYSPQKLKGKDNKSAVQRLDYTYKYVGVVDVKGTKYHRVTASLDLNTDLAGFFHQVTELKPSETGIKEFPLQLKATIDFDLDLKTRQTIRASAKSTGGFKLVTTDFPEDPLQEAKLNGSTELRLVK